MLEKQRQQLILDILAEQRFASVRSLASDLGARTQRPVEGQRAAIRRRAHSVRRHRLARLGRARTRVLRSGAVRAIVRTRPRFVCPGRPPPGHPARLPSVGRSVPSGCRRRAHRTHSRAHAARALPADGELGIRDARAGGRAGRLTRAREPESQRGEAISGASRAATAA